MEIHITRNGERHGPYPEASAREMLAAGQLQPTDLAWHAGADGWKPLSEVLGAVAQPPATPPPTPPQLGGAQPKPAEEKAGESEAKDSEKIQVTRGGEPIGPYSRDKAWEYYIDGHLLPTDLGWHDGMDEWKPLNEVLGLPPPDQMASAHSSMPLATPDLEFRVAAPTEERSRDINLASIAIKVVPSVVLVLMIVSLMVNNEHKWIPALIIAAIGGLTMATAYIWAVYRSFKVSVVYGIVCLFFVGVFRRHKWWDNNYPQWLLCIGIGILFCAGWVSEPSQRSEEGSNLSAEERKLVGKFEHISANGDTERWTFLKDNVAEKYKNGKKEGTSYKWKIYQTRWWKRDKGIIDGTIYVEHEDGSVTGFSREVIYTSMQAQAPIQEITISFFIGKDGEKTDVGGSSVKKTFKRE